MAGKKPVNRGETNGFEFLVRNGGGEELKKSLGLDWENMYCWHCGRHGHIMKQCTVPKEKRLPRKQRMAVAAGKAFVSDDGEFIPMVLPSME